MLVLCGFSLSNYYNKVKMALLEKGVPFTEEVVMTGSRDEAVLASTPLGKIPFIRTEQGTLCESQAIMEYLEDRYSELVVRELYPQAFFGGTVSDSNKARVRKLLEKNIAGFRRLARFAPYVAGATFTQADCAAWASLPLVGLATKIVYGEDLLASSGIDWKAYSKLVGERPSARKVTADRKADQERMTAASRPS